MASITSATAESQTKSSGDAASQGHGLWLRRAAFAGLALFSLSPSLGVNAWPQVEQMLARGAADAVTATAAVFQVASVVFMALAWTVAFRTRKILTFLGAFLLGSVLASYNFWNAVEIASHKRDSITGSARELIDRAAGLDTRIAAALNARKLLPQVTPATPAAVSAATSAVRAAELARDQECGRVGDNCRLRVADVTARNAELAAVVRDADITARADELDAEIGRLRDERASIIVPAQIDPTASRIAKIIGVVVNLGDNPEAVVSEWWPTWMGFGVELLAAFGTMIAHAIVYGDERRERRTWRLPRIRRRDAAAVLPSPSVAAAEVASTPAPAPAAAPEPAVSHANPATPAAAKKPSKIKPALVRGSGSVREWKETRTLARADARIKPGEAHAAYVEWCRDRGEEPVSLTAFGMAMKGSLGVAYEERSKRGFYVGIQLVNGLRVVASR